MIAALNFWGPVLALALVLPICALLAFAIYCLHHDSQGETVRVRFSRIIPWTTASRARHARAEAELEEAKADLFDLRHKRLQKETVFNELEENVYRRAIEGTKGE